MIPSTMPCAANVLSRPPPTMVSSESVHTICKEQETRRGATLTSLAPQTPGNKLALLP